MRLTVFVRKFKSSDLEECTLLFYDTVHTVNARDYNANQLILLRLTQKIGLNDYLKV